MQLKLLKDMWSCTDMNDKETEEMPPESFEKWRWSNEWTVMRKSWERLKSRGD